MTPVADDRTEPTIPPDARCHEFPRGECRWQYCPREVGKMCPLYERAESQTTDTVIKIKLKNEPGFAYFTRDSADTIVLCSPDHLVWSDVIKRYVPARRHGITEAAHD
jgi:hypothetical protein